MNRKIATLLILCLLLPASVVLANNASDMTMLDKVGMVEKVLYGGIQTGSLVERVTKVEKDLYGQQDAKLPLASKVDKLYAYAIETTEISPSIVVKLNAVEWALTHNVTQDAAKARIENLERILLGNSVTGAYDERLTKLIKLAYADGKVQTSRVTLAKDTLVKIKLLSALNTKQSRVGDTVNFQVVTDVVSGDVLTLAQGAKGIGKVTKIEPSKNFGRDAKLEVSFDTVEAIDSSIVATVLGDKAKEETKSLAKAAGATMAGLVILGPVGLVGGAFVHGEEVNIPAGSEMFIQTSGDTELFGIRVK